MTNAELIAKIKTEIDKRYAEYREKMKSDDFTYYEGMADALDLFEQFIDSLESETTYDTQQYTPRPSVGIEDVARVQFASHAKVFDKKRKAVFDWEQFKEVAGIFYGFGKKDRSDTLESEKPMNQDEDLKKEIERQLAIFPYTKVTPELPESRFLVIQKELFLFARHFAKWGYLRAAEKYNEIEYNRQREEESVPNDLEEAANKFAVFYDQGTCDGIAQDCFIAGSKWQKEQMMKEAVEGEVRKDGTIGYFEFSNEQQFHSLLEQFQDCDKVRIVIVKEDEK